MINITEEAFKKKLAKMSLEQKCEYLDNIWELTGGYSWTLFLPSFYLTHTKEEVEKATNEEARKIQEVLRNAKLQA